MDNLDKDLAEMRRLGYTSYGRYKLDYPNTKQPTQKKSRQLAPPVEYRRVCAFCGNEFVTTNHRTMYCSDDCKERGIRRRYNERQREKKKKPKAVGRCIICGAPFEKLQVTNICCSSKCKRIRNLQVQKAWRARQKGAK